jgi:PAS domain S-box-containing protein
MQTHTSLSPAQSGRFPLVAASIAIGIGALALIGWLSNHSLLATGFSGLPVTHPTTALWLLIVGCTLALLTLPSPTPWHQRSTALLASLVILTASLTLSMHLFGWPDTSALLLHPLPQIHTSIPDFPPVQTALSICCLSTALLLRTIAPTYGARLLALLVALPILLSLLALIGQLYHQLVLFADIPLSGMSLPAAISLLILSGGTLALYPDCRLLVLLHSTGQDGVLARRLLPISLGMPLFFGASARIGQQLGWYDAQGTLAVVTICTIIALLAVSWWAVTTVRVMDTERANMAHTSHQLAVQRQRLLEVAQSLLTTPAVDAILTQVQQNLAAVVAYDGFGIYWLDATAGHLQPALMVTTERSVAAFDAVPLPIDHGIAATVVQTGRGEMVNNAHADPRSFYPPGVTIAREHLICLPLRANDQTIGVFLMSRNTDVPFTTDTFELVQLFIGYAALALANARLFEAATCAAARTQVLLIAAERQAKEVALIDQVRAALARELDLAVMFRTVVEAIAATFGYTQVSLYICDDDGLYLQHQVGYEHVISYVPLTAGVSGRVVRTRQAVLLEDVQSDPAFLGAIAGIVSEVCVPLFDAGEVAGTLNVESTHGVRLSEADLRLMMALSQHVSIAIGRARLYTAVRESEARFATIFRNSPVAITITTVADGRFVDVNATFLALMGYRREEVIGQTTRALDVWATPADRARVVAALEDQQVLRSMTLAFRTKAGAILETLASIERIDLAGEQCLLSMTQDMTAHNQATAERERLIDELREALANIKTLRGLLPICASCKKIRDDTGYWNLLEHYIQLHADVAFSHGICPDCAQRLYPDLFDN